MVAKIIYLKRNLINPPKYMYLISEKFKIDFIRGIIGLVNNSIKMNIFLLLVFLFLTNSCVFDKMICDVYVINKSNIKYYINFYEPSNPGSINNFIERYYANDDSITNQYRPPQNKINHSISPNDSINFCFPHWKKNNNQISGMYFCFLNIDTLNKYRNMKDKLKIENVSKICFFSKTDLEKNNYRAIINK